jgi:hypothetical protein
LTMNSSESMILKIKRLFNKFTTYDIYILNWKQWSKCRSLICGCYFDWSSKIQSHLTSHLQSYHMKSTANINWLWCNSRIRKSWWKRVDLLEKSLCNSTKTWLNQRGIPESCSSDELSDELLDCCRFLFREWSIVPVRFCLQHHWENACNFYENESIGSYQAKHHNNYYNQNSSNFIYLEWLISL